MGWDGIVTFMYLVDVENFQTCCLKILGYTRKTELSTLNCFKAFGFGNGDGTVEIAKAFSVSPALL